MTELDYTRMVARNLRRIAYENGKTQADIAKDLHISKATVSSWMNGTRLPRMEKIDLLCNYFNCKRVDIMEETDEAKNKGGYYLNPETAQIAQEVFDNPELRILFDAARDSKPQDLLMAAEMLKRFKDTNPDG